MASLQSHPATGRAPTSGRQRTLSVLVVGTDDWAIEQAAAALEGAGHHAARCHDPGQPAFPCNALIAGRGCPLDRGVDAVVTSRARPLAVPAPGEAGVICALHAHVPLVVSGITEQGPFAPYAARTVTGEGTVAAACEAAATTVIQLNGEGV